MIAQLEKHPAVVQWLGSAVTAASTVAGYCERLLPVLQAAAALVAFVSGALTVAFQIRQWRRGRVAR